MTIRGIQPGKSRDQTQATSNRDAQRSGWQEPGSARIPDAHDQDLQESLWRLLKRYKEAAAPDQDALGENLREFATRHPDIMLLAVLGREDVEFRRLAMAVLVAVSRNGRLFLQVLKEANDTAIERLAIGALGSLRFTEAWADIERRTLSQSSDARLRLDGMDALFAIDRDRLASISLSSMLAAGLAPKYVSLLSPGAPPDFGQAVLDLWREEQVRLNDQRADGLRDDLMRMPPATILSLSEKFLISERNQTVRNRLIFGLADAPSEVSLPLLSRLAAVPSDLEDRLQAIYALGQIGTEDAFEALLKAIAPGDSDDFGLRVLNICEKGLEQFPSVRPFLLFPARDSNSPVIRTAMTAEWHRFGGTLAEVMKPVDCVSSARQVIRATDSQIMASYAARILCSSEASSFVTSEDLILSLTRTGMAARGRSEAFSKICAQPRNADLCVWSTGRVRSRDKKDDLIEYGALYLCKRGDALERSSSAPDLRSLLNDPVLGLRIAKLAVELGDEESLVQLRELLPEDAPTEIRKVLE